MFCFVFRPLDRAIWWMEHVIRHPKLYAGKAAVHKLTWAQYFLVDVIAFTALVTLLNSRPLQDILVSMLISIFRY